MNKNNSGVSICGVLAIVFIILKLIGVIEWSWLWILAPLWAPFLILVLVALMVVIFR